MPLTLEKLQAETRPLDVPFAGDVLHIVYRPGLVTVSRNGLPMRQWVSDVVESWDLEAGGEPYPLTADALAELPDPFLKAVITAIAKDDALDPTTSGSFADG